MKNKEQELLNNIQDREIYINLAIFQDLDSFYQKFTISSEIGGYLIGVRDQKKVVVLGAFFPNQAISNDVKCEIQGKHLIVVRELLSNLTKNVEKKNQVSIVGWIHTHPGITAFLSEQDYSTFTDYSAWDREAIAVIYDPHEKDRKKQYYVCDFQLRRIKFTLYPKENINLDAYGTILEDLIKGLQKQYENDGFFLLSMKDTCIFGIKKLPQISQANNSGQVEGYYNIARDIKNLHNELVEIKNDMLINHQLLVEIRDRLLVQKKDVREEPVNSNKLDFKEVNNKVLERYCQYCGKLRQGLIINDGKNWQCSSCKHSIHNRQDDYI